MHSALSFSKRFRLHLALILLLLSLLLLLSCRLNLHQTITWDYESKNWLLQNAKDDGKIRECGNILRLGGGGGRELTPWEEESLAVYRRQLAGRRLIIQQLLDDPASHHALLYFLLVPEVRCDGLVRLGEIYDGGKWICSPSCVPPGSNIYSLGLNDVIGFDTELWNVTGGKCPLRMVDKEEQREETQAIIAAMNASLLIATVGPEQATNEAIAEGDDEKVYSLAELMRHFGDEQIEILKVDIDGAEDAVLRELVGGGSTQSQSSPSLRMPQLPPCQLLVELHNQSASEKTAMLHSLSSAGYYYYATEASPFVLEAREFSFIHERCLAAYGVDVIYGRYLS